MPSSQKKKIKKAVDKQNKMNKKMLAFLNEQESSFNKKIIKMEQKEKKKFENFKKIFCISPLTPVTQF